MGELKEISNSFFKNYWERDFKIPGVEKKEEPVEENEVERNLNKKSDFKQRVKT